MSTYFVGGFKVDEFGTLQTSIGPAVGYHAGVPVDADGNVVVSEAAPTVTDPFIAGQRVLNSGALCIVTDTPPVPNGFDSGLSNGFGA